MYLNVHCSTVYSSQNTETTYISIKRWMHKEDVAHTNSGIYSAIKKNEIMTFAAIWMRLEIVVWSEVSQRQHGFVQNLRKERKK